MSREHKQRRVVVTCAGCKKNSQVNEAWLLEQAAQALSACAAAGLHLKVRHGIVACEEGLILPLDDGSFVARTRTYSPFSPQTTTGNQDDDLDT